MCGVTLMENEQECWVQKRLWMREKMNVRDYCKNEDERKNY